jgi:hypothetical protein
MSLLNSFPDRFSSISPSLKLQLLLFFLWSLSSPVVGSAEHFCFYARKATVLALEMSGEAIVLQQNYIFSQRHFTYSTFYNIYINFSPKKSCLVASKNSIHTVYQLISLMIFIKQKLFKLLQALQYRHQQYKS